MERVLIGIVLFIVLFILSFIVGGLLSMYFFLGILTLLGLIITVESICILRYLFRKSYNIIDVIFYGINFVMLFMLGVTVVASFIVANIGYSLIYKPYLKYRNEIEVKKRKELKKVEKVSIDSFL